MRPRGFQAEEKCVRLLHVAGSLRAVFQPKSVDQCGQRGGVVSAAHTLEDTAQTLAAFDGTLDLLAAEGEL